MNDMLRTNEKQDLTSHPQRRKTTENSCVASIKWGVTAVKSQKVKDFKTELKKHALKITGKKQQLRDRLIACHETVHDTIKDQAESD